METIIESWQYSFFAQPLFELLLLIAFIYTVQKSKQHRALKLIPFYLGAFIVSRITVYALQVFAEDPGIFRMVNALLSYAISWIEFITFFWFLYYSNKWPKFRQVIQFLGILGILLYVFRLPQVLPVVRETGLYLVHMMYSVESIILLLMGCFYIASWLAEKDLYEIQRTPVFWIFCGLLVYVVGNIPLRIVSNYLFFTEPDLYRSMFASTFSCYILLILMILKGYQYVAVKDTIINKSV